MPQASSQRPNPMPNRSINDHGVIGNLDTAALVALDGAVDYLCWPHLDSPTIFAALLDPDAGGEFTLQPHLDNARTVQAYVPDTNVLTTRWLATEGALEVVDLMPYPHINGNSSRMLIRRVRATRGTITVSGACRPRFDYARLVPRTFEDEASVVFKAEDSPSLRLDATVALAAQDGEAVAKFTLKQDETAWFVLLDEDEDRPSVAELETIYARTLDAWRKWTARSNYKGRWREEVARSALALKLLTSAEHGSIAAAATFGLPEATDASRNWDYRATWIRDAAFTIYAFLRLGHVEEAEQFRGWVNERMMHLDDGALEVMYAMDGSEAADEVELHQFAGYAGAKPVRIGNAAHTQDQLDVYGELLDSVYLANKYGSAISREGWLGVQRIIEHVRENWDTPDAGIWEIRGEPRHFLHSRLMCWVAIDRAVRLARKRSLPAPFNEWEMERNRIAEDIWANFRHPEHGYFVQHKGSTDLDAAVLMMPLVRFVSATDPVWLKTLDAIGEQLTSDGMVYRYLTHDGLEGGEGAFTTCTFWYVECLARANRLEEAQSVMSKALLYSNHLGLFSEELDERALALGNFPQALTHLAFISAAYFLNRRLDSPDGDVWQP
ncbi:glucoamylase [Devosia pacifica]|uniref:Glucoamylase n=1 Tax=Devosia pacifica TaxID=1335967 RepID=A0A918VSV1_9HYPH|nr:glycoside hydrolase family 15 protein [Devosia pacifica]GHA21267.1 glucoamylase [Devosia pacifica]